MWTKSSDVDFDTVNEHGHRAGCDCETCLPEGAEDDGEEVWPIAAE